MVFFYMIGALCVASSVAKAYFDTKKAVKPEFVAKLLASVSFMFCAVYAIYNNQIYSYAWTDFSPITKATTNSSTR